VAGAKVIAIGGASGAGKSYLARALVDKLRQDNPAPTVTSLSLDAYYRDLSHLSLAQRAQINFDHPDALELDLFAHHLSELRAGRSVSSPQYDFSTHTRHEIARELPASDVVVVDGLLLTAAPALRALYDVLVFIDTDLELCFSRRMARDTRERGRTPASVADFWHGRALPMFAQFGAHTKADADLIVSGTQPLAATLSTVLAKLTGAAS